MIYRRTAECISKAENFLAEGSEDSMTFATLLVRMAIEFLFYEHIPLYRDELPHDILTARWRPQDILEAILDCDPSADKDATLLISETPPSEAEQDPKALTFSRKAPSKRLLKKHYHRICKYLHAPVDLQPFDAGHWRKDIESAISTVKEFKNSRALFNIAPFITFPCEACGTTIKRNKHAIEANGEVRCLKPSCRAIHDVKVDKATHIKLRQSNYACPYCQTNNFVPAHAIADGVSLICVECDRTVVVKSMFGLVQSPEADASRKT